MSSAAIDPTIPGLASKRRSAWRHWALAIPALALCFPLLWLGYGADGDAWLVAHSAMRLAAGEGYRPSRPPGYPLHEWITAGLIPWGGWLASNAFSLLCAAAAVVAFHRVLRLRGERSAFASLAFMALHPSFLKNAATTMDYAPALAAALLSYCLALRGMAARSGIALALAIGFRPTSALAFAPAAWAVWQARRRKRVLALLAALAAALSAILYIPVYRALGMGMFQVGGESSLSLTYKMLAGGYRAVSFCGAPATAAILCGLAWTLLRAPRTMIEAMRDEAFLTIALVGALFAAHSDETDYLLIGLPFLAIFLARALPRKAWLAAIALSVLHGIVTLDLVGGPSGQRRFEPRLTLGVLPSDAWLRVRDLRLRAAFGELAAKAQSPYLLINEMQSLDFAHSALHETPLELGRDSMSAKQYENKAFFIVPALSREAIGNALELGWRVGFFDASRGQIAAKAGFDPESAGAQAIDSAALARMPDWPIKKR